MSALVSTCLMVSRRGFIGSNKTHCEKDPLFRVCFDHRGIESDEFIMSPGEHFITVVASCECSRQIPLSGDFSLAIKKKHQIRFQDVVTLTLDLLPLAREAVDKNDLGAFPLQPSDRLPQNDKQVIYAQELSALDAFDDVLVQYLAPVLHQVSQVVSNRKMGISEFPT